MFFSKLFSKKNSILGVDIGTANIKIAQVAHAEKPILQTYGMVNCPYQLGGKNDLAAVPAMAKLLRDLLVRAGATTKRCVISFPNIAVFSSVVEMPKMNDRDLGQAVEHEAKKYVPLPLSDIDLSWTALSGSTSGQNNMKVLLTAVPKQITKNYLRLFEQAGLEPEVGEIEGLALIRSLVGESAANCVIIDIGARSTGLNIVEGGFLRMTRNLNIGGETITVKLAQTLRISEARAEQFKKDFGISGSTFIPETIKPILNLIKSEVKQLLTLYHSQNNEKLDRVILVGGGAQLPGITGFFEDLNVTAELGNPLKAVSFDQDTAEVMERYALSLPVAIGLALRQE